MTVPGLAPVMRNRVIAPDGAAKSVNRELEAKARSLAELKGYVTNLAACPKGTPVTAEFVIGCYHRLFEIGPVSVISACRTVPAGQTQPATTLRMLP